MGRSFAAGLTYSQSSEAYEITNFSDEEPYVFENTIIFFRGYISNIDSFFIDSISSKKLPKGDTYAKCFYKAYKDWGKDLSKNVQGEYAVTIFDCVKQELLLTHDTLGLVPLYYYQISNQIYFGSHLEPLIQLGSKLELDQEYLADFICYGDHYGNKTPYKEIKRIMPDSAIQFDNGRLSIHDCLRLTTVGSIRYTKSDDYADHLRELIQNAVKNAMPVAGNIWCELSGGLDSSTVLASAANIDPSRLSAFSFIYSESKRSDESLWINSVLERFNIKSIKLDADRVSPFSEIPMGNFAAPFHAMINWGLYRKYGELLLENNVDVVLTGMGGDAVLFGDGPEPFFLGDLLQKFKLRKLAKEVKYWTTHAIENRPTRYWIERCAIQAISRQFKNQLIQDHPPKISWLDDNYKYGELRNGKPRLSWVAPKNSISDSWVLERILRSANVVSFWDHRHSMRAEFRHPLMALSIIDFMRSIPVEQQFSPILDRMLQRKAFKNILPENIVNRKTKGSPDHAIYSGLEKGKEWLRLITGNTIMAEKGYVDTPRWNQAVALARQGRCESIKLFKAAVSLEIWLRQLGQMK